MCKIDTTKNKKRKYVHNDSDNLEGHICHSNGDGAPTFLNIRPSFFPIELKYIKCIDVLVNFN